MSLSQNLIDQFAKLTKKEEEKKEVTVRGTYKKIDNVEYVQLDGSDILTPVTSTVEAETGEKVNVLIKNHTATVTGNISSPSARNKSVQDLKDEVDEYGNTIKQLDNSILQQGNSIIQINNAIKQQENTINQFKNTINQQGNTIQQLDTIINQQGDRITSLNNTIVSQGNKINSMNNTIEEHGNTIKRHDNTIIQQGNTISQQGNLIEQQGNTIKQFDTAITTMHSSIEIFNSAFKIENGVLTGLSEIVVNELETNTLNAKYANIDFTNIGEAAIKNLFTDSGIIKDLIMSDGKVTGELVGVTIKGDLIEANTLKADKLVILGEDGLYYKLNVNALGEAVASSDEKYQNGLDGSVIVAKSLTAEKVAVDDLVAFGATIGGYHINSHSLYSGAKASATNTTRGVFLGDDGQFAIGDSNNFLRFFKDTDGQFKLELKANSIKFGTSGSTLEDAIQEVDDKIDDLVIGGRNLLIGTDIDKVFTFNGGTNQVGDIYSFSQYYKDNYYKYTNTEGENLTIAISFDWSTTATSGDIQIQLNGTPWTILAERWTVSELNQSGHIEAIATIAKDSYDPIEYNATYIRTDNLVGDVTISNMKVEVGNKTTDWTPAPEDVDLNVDEVDNKVQDQFNEVNTNISEAQSSIDQLSNMISHLITDENGGSLMTQTPDGWTFNMSTINNNLNAIKDAVADVENTSSETVSAVDKLTSLINDITNKTAYITMATDENGDPCIELGKSDSLFKVRITNTAIDFLEGSTRIAYANNRTFYAEKMIIKNELQIGDGPGFVWKTRTNGHLGLTYIPPEAPVISNFKAFRCDSEGNENQNGTYIKAEYNWETQIAPTEIGLQRRMQDSEFWMTTTAPATTDKQGTFSSIVGSGTISVDNTYEVRAYVKDSYGGETYTEIKIIT